MKRIVFIMGIMLVSIIVLLENSSGKRKKQIHFIPEKELEYDDVWWDN